MTQPPHNLPLDPSDVEGLDLGPATMPSDVPPVSIPKDAFAVPPLPPAPVAPKPVTPPPTPTINVMPPKAPSQPVDIFADTKEAPRNTSAPTRVLPPLPEASPSSSTLKYVALGFGGLVVCVGVAFAGWKLFNVQSTNTLVTTPAPTTPPPVAPTAPSIDQTAQPTQPTDTPTTNSVIPEPITTPPAGINIPLPSMEVTTTATTVPDPTLDSDKDGLTDVRETQLGSDPQKPDTDGDGLSDGDELLKYGTNPLNPDTDGDGYQDGAEVSKGYDPRGSGKCATQGCIVP